MRIELPRDRTGAVCSSTSRATRGESLLATAPKHVTAPITRNLAQIFQVEIALFKFCCGSFLVWIAIA